MNRIYFVWEEPRLAASDHHRAIHHISARSPQQAATVYLGKPAASEAPGEGQNTTNVMVQADGGTGFDPGAATRFWLAA